MAHSNIHLFLLVDPISASTATASSATATASSANVTDGGETSLRKDTIKMIRQGLKNKNKTNHSCVKTTTIRCQCICIV